MKVDRQSRSAYPGCVTELVIIGPKDLLTHRLRSRDDRHDPNVSFPHPHPSSFNETQPKPQSRCQHPMILQDEPSSAVRAEPNSQPEFAIPFWNWWRKLLRRGTWKREMTSCEGKGWPMEARSWLVVRVIALLKRVSRKCNRPGFGFGAAWIPFCQIRCWRLDNSDSVYPPTVSRTLPHYHPGLIITEYLRWRVARFYRFTDFFWFERSILTFC